MFDSYIRPMIVVFDLLSHSVQSFPSYRIHVFFLQLNKLVSLIIDQLSQGLSNLYIVRIDAHSYVSSSEAVADSSLKWVCSIFSCYSLFWQSKMFSKVMSAPVLSFIGSERRNSDPPDLLLGVMQLKITSLK